MSYEKDDLSDLEQRLIQSQLVGGRSLGQTMFELGRRTREKELANNARGENPPSSSARPTLVLWRSLALISTSALVLMLAWNGSRLLFDFGHQNSPQQNLVKQTDDISKPAPFVSENNALPQTETFPSATPILTRFEPSQPVDSNDQFGVSTLGGFRLPLPPPTPLSRESGFVRPATRLGQPFAF